LYIAALVGCPLVGMVSTGHADDIQPSEQAAPSESVTIRGKTLQVWPMDDLRARGFDIPDVPREENAYFIYLDAMNAFKDVPADVVPAFEYAVQNGWPTGHDEKLAAYLLDADNQRAMALALRAAGYEKCQLSYYGDPNGGVISVLLPDLSSFRFLCKILVAEGRRLEAQGAYEQALRNYTTAMRMGGQVANGITLIENLVGVAAWALGDHAVAQMVLRRELSAKQLKDILRELNELAEVCPKTHNGIRNERIFGLTMVDELVSNPAHIVRNVHAFTGSGLYGTEVGSIESRQSGWRGLEARIGRLIFPDRTIKAHMNSYYEELIERAQMPAYQAQWNVFDESGIVDAIPKWDELAHIFLPSLSRASILGERGRMQAITTRLAVALRLYALENNGEAPSRLEKLRPWVAEEDLIDPFSGKTFAYDHRDGAWRFYSFSENLEDDGGEEGEKRFVPDFVVRFPPKAVEAFTPKEDEGVE
jgi:tetratricopeptide (TPR) repeat protein